MFTEDQYYEERFVLLDEIVWAEKEVAVSSEQLIKAESELELATLKLELLDERAESLGVV